MLGLCLPAAPAEAQPARTFVSAASGADAPWRKPTSPNRPRGERVHNCNGPKRIPRGRHRSSASCKAAMAQSTGACQLRSSHACAQTETAARRSALHETGGTGRCPVARVVVDGVVAKRKDGAAVDRAESDVVRRHHRGADEDLRAGSAGPDARTTVEIGRRALDIQIDRGAAGGRDADDAEAAVGADQGVLYVGEDDATSRARRAKALEIPLQLDPLQ